MTGVERSDLAETTLAADSDREAVAVMLHTAAGEGRISLDELDERTGRALRARTYGELRALVADLPRAIVLAEPETLTLSTTAPHLKQSGRWTVPRRIVAESTSGFITIDFTHASCAHREIAVEAATRSGRIRLILPAGWAARVSPSSTNTAHISNKATEIASPGSPTVILTGRPLSGYIKVRQR
jgi:hypothetical protein